MKLTKIACCTDFSENAQFAFEEALELAQKYNAELHVIHVLPTEINPTVSGTIRMLPDSTQKALIPELEKQMAEEYEKQVAGKVDCQLVVRKGHVSTEIVNYLKDEKIGLVVLGSFGLSGIGLVVFGSVAKRVSHHAPCSVLIVRPEMETDG